MLLGGLKRSLLPQLLPILMVMHLREEPLGPLNVYEQKRVHQIMENQAGLAACGLGAARNALEVATQPTAKKGKRRRADQENISEVLSSCGCGANACCAHSQHKWQPPTSLQSMQSHVKLQQLCRATQVPLSCRLFQPLIAYCAGRRCLSLTMRPQQQQRW